MVLDDGMVPRHLYFDATSGGGGQAVSQWTVYDDRPRQDPRAAALRGVCSCGWNGPEQRLVWEQIGGQDLQEAGAGAGATRYDKLAVRYEVTVLVAMINEWI